MHTLQALIIVSLLLSAQPAGVARADEAPPFLIIVNATNPATTVDRKFLREAFLKKKTRWPGGGIIRPVDQRTLVGVRSRFSEGVLERSVAAVRQYWLQRIFAGREVPPPELENDAQVVQYVLLKPGAVGYVSTTANITGAKALRIE
jgi:ABC-type phosphate transport system substrate-binding protein